MEKSPGIELRTLTTEAAEVSLEHLPVGIRVIGEINPKKLTPTEFQESPDVLFHGSSREFEFDSDFDYVDPRSYDRCSDGSTTLGVGFYTIPTAAEAEVYSRVRNPNNAKRPIVLQLLPYKARMLDLRAKNDETKNGHLPFALMIEWRPYIERELRQVESTILAERREPKKSRYYYTLQRYLAFLDKLIASNRTYWITTVLGTSDDPEVKTPNMPFAPWSHIWTHFMRTKGIDGVINHEGSEGGGTGGATYAFYNPKVVGTYESWQKQKDEDAST